MGVTGAWEKQNHSLKERQQLEELLKFVDEKSNLLDLMLKEPC